MTGQEASSSQPWSSVGTSSRDAKIACWKVVNVLQAAWAEVPCGFDRKFMVDAEVDALEEGVNRFQQLSSYENIWLETEASTLVWLRTHLIEIQNALRYLVELDTRVKGQSGSDASSSAVPAFNVWRLSVPKGKAWLSCLEEWMSGVEADMIRRSL